MEFYIRGSCPCETTPLPTVCSSEGPRLPWLQPQAMVPTVIFITEKAVINMAAKEKVQAEPKN